LINAGELSSLMNIGQAIARSQKIIQESVELSKKNQDRKTRLSERVKASMPSAEKLNKPDIIPRATAYQDLPVASLRTDFQAHIGETRTKLFERTPVKEAHMSGLDDSMMSEPSFPKESSSQEEEVRLLRSQVADLQMKLIRQEDSNRNLKRENSGLLQPDRQVAGLKELMESRHNEVARVREELTCTKAELSKVMQKTHDQKHYIQSIEEERDCLKTEHSSSQTSLAYKDLYDRYIEVLNEKRLDDRRCQMLQQEVEALKQANLTLIKKVSEGRGHSYGEKIEDLEGKISQLEAKYASQNFENEELKMRLLKLLEKTGHSEQNYSKGSLPQLYDTDSSEERLVPRPFYKKPTTGVSKTPRTKSKKTLKKVKKQRDVSADRRRATVQVCCGRRQCGTCFSK
jgi:hypothetical protein